MLDKVRLLVLGFVVLLGSQVGAQVDWRALTLESAKKPIIYFPDVPEQRTDTVVTAVDTLIVNRFYHNDPQAMTGNRLYTLTVTAYPAGAIPPDSVALREALFEESVLATAETLNGTVIFSDTQLAGRWPCKIFRVDYAEDRASLYAQLYFVGDRYYQLQVYALKVDEGSRSRQRFFDNFAPALPDRSAESR